MQRIPYVDPMDVRYARHVRTPQPATEAVMFCLMDVSGSMTEHMKDLAKRFFMLLHLFLSRRYERVHVVFIRHTERAAEVDEETFFRSRETGGTLVSSALDVMLRGAGGALPARALQHLRRAGLRRRQLMRWTGRAVTMLMQERILPIVRYFAYVETGGRAGRVSAQRRAADQRAVGHLRGAECRDGLGESGDAPAERRRGRVDRARRPVCQERARGGVIR